MSKFEYRGDQTRTWPGHLHPEADGVLVAEPGEIIDFGEASPPADGQWYDVSSGEPSQDVEGTDEDDSDPGTGDAAEQED
jgi:hypothetical protein